MRRYYEIYTMQRSGNHAVLNWLFNQFDEPVLYFNNCIPYENPVYEMRRPDDSLQNIVDLMPYWGDTLRRPTLTPSSYKTVAVQFEWEIPSVGLTPKVPTHLMGLNSTRPGPVIIIRDIYNLLASRAYREKTSPWKTIQHWKNLAAVAASGTCPVILYNKWFSDPEYRRVVAATLYTSVQNDNINFVPRSGGGSSFDKRRYQDHGSEMDVLNRWKYLLEPQNSEVFELASDPELEYMNKGLFEFGCPWKWN